MILQWFDARRASEAGAALADKLTPAAARMEKSDVAPSESFREIVKRARGEVLDLKLNLYQRAKLANAFKWKLIENGIERKLADEVTQSLVMDLSTNRGAVPEAAETATAGEPAVSAAQLLAKANSHAQRGDLTSALELYQQVLTIEPRHAVALNNRGLALAELGRFIEAERHFRGALSINPEYMDAHGNLGDMLA